METTQAFSPTSKKCYLLLYFRPARIVDFQKWKHRTAKKSQGASRSEMLAQKMSARDMLLRIMGAVSETSLNGDRLRKMMLANEAIACGSKKKTAITMRTSRVGAQAIVIVNHAHNQRASCQITSYICTDSLLPLTCTSPFGFTGKASPMASRVG